MRHSVKGRKLNRTKSHRQATMRALASALLKHKKIRTTLAKAKETRMFVEPMITKAKVDSVANRRHIARDINDRAIVQELFNEIVPKVGDRPGGYTRVVKLGQRLGDAAEMAIIELVDYSEVADKKPRKKKEKKEESPVETFAPKEEVKEDEVQDAEVVEETESKEEVKAEDENEEPKTVPEQGELSEEDASGADSTEGGEEPKSVPEQGELSKDKEEDSSKDKKEEK